MCSEYCVYACVHEQDAVCVCMTRRLEVGHKVNKLKYLTLTSDLMI